MSLDSLMVYLDAEREQNNLVHIAANLASRFGSSLTGVSALGIRPPAVVVEGIVIDTGDDIGIEQMRAHLAAREAWFRNNVGDKARAIEWRAAVESPTEKLIRECRRADLVVMSAPGQRRDAYGRPDVGEVILRAGRPILVVPDNVEALKAERIVVGWKDVREARRVLLDSLPFLTRASEVSIVEICEFSQEPTPLSDVDEVRSYLEQHGVKCGCQFIVRPSDHVGKQLIATAKEARADLIVAGAYGHSRLGEWIFGGVTKELLSKSDICCLMSH